MHIGVLALQGDVHEHIQILESLGVSVVEVRSCEDLDAVSGLIIPGGESTTIGKLMGRYGLDKAIVDKYNSGMAIYGTCAGAILLAKDIVGSKQLRLGLMDITVSRNAYGRQVDSFGVDVEVSALGDTPVRAVFIRAPVIEKVGGNVGVLALHEGKIVMARQGTMLVTTFHPELTHDTRVHEYFLKMCSKK